MGVQQVANRESRAPVNDPERCWWLRSGHQRALLKRLDLSDVEGWVDCLSLTAAGLTTFSMTNGSMNMGANDSTFSGRSWVENRTF